MRINGMQPLKNSEEIAVVERGRQVLQLLQAHASSFPEQVQAAGSAAEECEREVEQEKEVEQQMEQQTHHNRRLARSETDWNSWEKALLCDNRQGFLQFAAGTQVQFNAMSIFSVSLGCLLQYRVYS
jgi:hypothetical protein